MHTIVTKDYTAFMKKQQFLKASETLCPMDHNDFICLVFQRQILCRSVMILSRLEDKTQRNIAGRLSYKRFLFHVQHDLKCVYIHQK